MTVRPGSRKDKSTAYSQDLGLHLLGRLPEKPNKIDGQIGGQPGDVRRARIVRQLAEGR
jgi:hypothetical protein